MRWDAPWKKPLVAAVAGILVSLAADLALDLSLLARCAVTLVAAYAVYGLLYWRTRDA